MQAVWNSNGFLFMWVQMWLKFPFFATVYQQIVPNPSSQCNSTTVVVELTTIHPSSTTFTPQPQKERRPKIQAQSLQPMCRIEKSSSSCPVWPVCCVHSADVRGLIGCCWWNLWRLCDLKDDEKRWIYHVGSWVGGCFWVVGNTQGHQKIREWSLNLRKSYSPFFV